MKELYLKNIQDFDEMSLDYIISKYKNWDIIEEESEYDKDLVDYVLETLETAKFIFYKRDGRDVAKVVFSKKEHTAEAALSAYLYTRENLLKEYERVELLEFKSDTLDGVYYGMFIVDL
jgi:uncharacterized protein related to proFAR isomerase